VLPKHNAILPVVKGNAIGVVNVGFEDSALTTDSMCVQPRVPGISAKPVHTFQDRRDLMRLLLA
jgi:hypothetical protein